MGAHRPRVAITGIGVVSPFGVGREVFWEGVSAGASGIRAITDFDASALTCRVSGSVPEGLLSAADALISGGGEAPPSNGRADPRHYAKVSRLAVLAAREAFRDAGIEPGDADAGVIVGSGAGGIDVAERQYRGVLQRCAAPSVAVRDSRVDRRHRVERDTRSRSGCAA